MSQGNLLNFIVESNKIEGIHDLRIAHEQFPIYGKFLRTPLEPRMVIAFAKTVTGGAGRIRDKRGMNVRVGRYVPPPGGMAIRTELRRIIEEAGHRDADMWRTHVEFESLHPFMDGNGRTGRAIWLHQRCSWQDYTWDKETGDAIPQSGFRMDDVPPSFLHPWYYASLDNGRAALAANQEPSPSE